MTSQASGKAGYPMGLVADRHPERKAMRVAERAWVKSATGLVLTDSSLKPIAYNLDAALILSYPDQPSPKAQLRMPEEIIRDLRGHSFPGSLHAEALFRSGRRIYACQASALESCGGESRETVIVLVLQRYSSAFQAVYEVAARFNLTDRERQALEGISMGLSGKELAERMQISPNTVKAYVHLIMLKMGVATRAGIQAKLLEHNPGLGGSLTPSP